jgi:hypothetical protein
VVAQLQEMECDERWSASGRKMGGKDRRLQVEVLCDEEGRPPEPPRLTVGGGAAAAAAAGAGPTKLEGW